MKYLTLAILACMAAVTIAECPNACSGHGSCGSKDSCTCYQNYQANDCSERTCYFGISHVDTPKGDLNMDGAVSSPTVTVVTGSTVYPEGTVEQYPNSGSNEGHYYMECSNKGICNRKTGQCDCFAGYTGTACARAGCPNECSGHGTCESVRELAEMAIYNTNKKHVDSSSENTYSYHLWDQDKTMGCKCDPGYWGADCSLRKCKYGVDPLFYDDAPTPIHQTSVITIGATGTTPAAPTGTFKVIFYDVFGEKYVTRPISVSASVATVTNSLQALPNGVISSSAQKSAKYFDVDQTAQTAVTVVAGTEAYSAANAGAFADGDHDNDADGYTWTVTFKTNPGILKTIVIDTVGLAVSSGTLQATVANARKGEYDGRYVTSIGRIQAIGYGSDQLHLSSAATSDIVAGVLLKVGDTEYTVAAAPDANKHTIQLSSAYVGTTIDPFMTDTSKTVASYATTTVTLAASATLTVADKDKLYIKSTAGTYVCSVTAGAGSTGNTITTRETAVVKVDSLVYCSGFTGATHPLYLRSEKFSNANAYKTKTTADAGDTTTALTSTANNYAHFTQGSTRVHFFAHGYAKTLKNYKAASTSLVTSADATGDSIAGYVLANGEVWTVASVHATNGIVLGNNQNALSGKHASKCFQTTDNSAETVKVYKAVASDANFAAGAVILVGGRRYTVASTDGNAAPLYFDLSEPYHGRKYMDQGPLVKICSACVTGIATADGGLTLTVTASKIEAVAAGDTLFVGGFTNEGDAIQVITAALADATSVVGMGGASKSTQLVAASNVDLYKLSGNQWGLHKIYSVTQSAALSTFNYVSQCSNRGSCDDSTGICKCYKGYSNDNCDTQNMLAA